MAATSDLGWDNDSERVEEGSEDVGFERSGNDGTVAGAESKEGCFFGTCGTAAVTLGGESDDPCAGIDPSLLESNCVEACEIGFTVDLFK